MSFIDEGSALMLTDEERGSVCKKVGNKKLQMQKNGSLKISTGLGEENLLSLKA